MMLPTDLFRLAFSNLLLHKARSILTSLGVIFGVGSVIAMLAISEGAKRKALEQIEAMGIDNILVVSKKPPITGQKTTSRRGMSDEKYGLVENDYRNIEKMENVSHITTGRDARKTIHKGLERLDLKLVAVSPEFLADTGSKINSGRWLSSVDGENMTMACVIGRNVKRRLFPLGTHDVVGKDVKVEELRLRIVGILSNDVGTQLPELGNVENFIFIPIQLSQGLYKDFTMNTSERRVQPIEYDIFIIKVNDITYIDDTAKRIGAYMAKTHSKTKDYDIIVPLDLLKQREATQNIFTLVMGSIAGISLVVGGIGIMNIMLASVYERRKEIGTRRALGAQKSDILLQFLIETVFLTSQGGIIGILMGIGISQIIMVYAQMPMVYSAWSIIVSLVISSLVGVIYGTYPAWKAAQQNPITVLRAE